MTTIHDLTEKQREEALPRVVRAFVEFCRLEYGIALYAYQVRIAEACLSSLLVRPVDVFIKLSRQSGKTETVTLLLRFLIIFYRLFTGSPLMAGIASPTGEQAKTDVDRVKTSIQGLRARWQVEDREFNVHTVRAYRFDEHYADIFRFSLSPNTKNESKTLNLLLLEESHKADDKKRSDELDPMLASTGGVTFYIGVGCPRTCDFQRGCAGELAESVAIVVPVDEVIADRRKKYEETKDPKHLEYEKFFARELRKKGKENPEIRMNYYLEDIVETGNFVSRERLLSCGRASSVAVPVKKLFFGMDWGRKQDFTWAFVVNNQNDIVDMVKIPHARYEAQIQLANDWLRGKRTEKLEDGSTAEFTYEERILAACSDSTGQGDMATETLETATRLPMGPESAVKFTTQSKHDMYTILQDAIYRDPGDPMRLSYPADHPLAAEFEEQMCCLEKTYVGEGEYLSVNHPEDDPNAHDDAPDACVLALYAAKSGEIGELLVA